MLWKFHLYPQVNSYAVLFVVVRGTGTERKREDLKGTDEDRRKKIEKSEKNSVILLVFIKLYKKKKILTFCTKGLLNWNIEKVTFWNYINVSFML